MLVWGSLPKIPIVRGSENFQVGEHIHLHGGWSTPTPRAQRQVPIDWGKSCVLQVKAYGPERREEGKINTKKQKALIQKLSWFTTCNLCLLIQKRKSGGFREWEQPMEEREGAIWLESVLFNKCIYSKNHAECTNILPNAKPSLHNLLYLDTKKQQNVIRAYWDHTLVF